MAKRDFAKVQSQAKSGGNSRKPVVMIAISLLFTAAVAFTAGNMMGNKQNSPDALKTENNGLKTQLTEKKQQLIALQEKVASLQVAVDKRPAKKPQQNATQRVGDLTFYSSLPKQKVMPSPLGDTGPAAKMKAAPRASLHVPSHKPLHNKPPQSSLPSESRELVGNHMGENGGAAAANMTSYRLQVASYIRRSDAEGFFNRLAKAGLVAQIREKMVDGIGVRYRVVMGPYRGLAAASAAKSQVREKMNIDGLLLRE